MMLQVNILLHACVTGHQLLIIGGKIKKLLFFLMCVSNVPLLAYNMDKLKGLSVR
jgi:hypothetical protein